MRVLFIAFRSLYIFKIKETTKCKVYVDDLSEFVDYLCILAT